MITLLTGPHTHGLALHCWVVTNTTSTACKINFEHAPKHTQMHTHISVYRGKSHTCNAERLENLITLKMSWDHF